MSLIRSKTQIIPNIIDAFGKWLISRLPVLILVWNSHFLW
jgi:hypothetical protein